MNIEVEKIQQKCREDIFRLQATTRLDFNLERGRLYDEQSELLAKIKEAETNLGQEAVQLRAIIERVKYDTYRALLSRSHLRIQLT